MRAWAVLLACMLSLSGLQCCGNETHMKSIQETKRTHETRLLALPDVVSVGIGMDADGEEAIIVGLAAPNPETQALIPQKLGEYPVIVRISGSVRAQ